jgi:hypothetical protein
VGVEITRGLEKARRPNSTSEARQGDAKVGGEANIPDNDMFGNGLAGGCIILSGFVYARCGVTDRDRDAGDIRGMDGYRELAVEVVARCFKTLASIFQSGGGRLSLWWTVTGLYWVMSGVLLT